MSITTKTRLFAVIGNPVSHSLSPVIHNVAFNALGLDFVYLAFKVEDLRSAIAGVRAMDNFMGLSVTIPHKTELIEYIDEISEIDRLIGSINTVVKENNRLVGYGTDGPGAIKALTDAGVSISGKNILMLGAGGAARAIAFSLLFEEPASLTILNREAELEMLDNLASDLKKVEKSKVIHSVLTEDSVAASMAKADIIIHCTSIGMFPNVNVSLVPKELFKESQTFFDVVYTPLETKLLSDAKSMGCKVISGVEMFVNQAALQFEYFSGKEAPVDLMRKVVMEHLAV
ncbi:MAG: shikimate dehydrogenase [Desulfuromonadales bacterium]|nr:shikimate dehydrogenase [Desulfuromonadales bacterium]